MFKNRFLLVLGVISLLLVSMAVSRPSSNTAKSANLSWPARPIILPASQMSNLSDYYQRHTAWTSNYQKASIPVTSVGAALYYFQRHFYLSAITGPGIAVDTTDYFVRQAELSSTAKSADLSWPPRPVIVPMTRAGDQSSIMDSATRSYVAWGEALKAANKLGDSVACSNTTQESIFDGIDNNLDSATRSYVASGLALKAAHHEKALDSGTRSYIAWGQALQAKNNPQALCQ